MKIIEEQLQTIIKRYKELDAATAKVIYVGCMRLSARIKELRDAGFPIVTEVAKQNGKTFARYRMAKAA